ncbi:MAG: PepSY domain-containing protein [Pseudomonadales bacterium]
MTTPVFAKRRLFGVLLATLLLLGSGVGVQARDYPDSRSKRQPQSAKPARISAGQAANIAQSATGAKVLAVKFQRGYYRVKLLRSNGVVFSARVDAYNGRIRR